MSDTAATPGSLPDASPADVGILFIHGIGSQQRGETLLKFGEPITARSAFGPSDITAKWRSASPEAAWPSGYDRIAAEWKSRNEGDRVLERFETIRALLEFIGGSEKATGPDTVDLKGPVAFRIGLSAARIGTRPRTTFPHTRA